MSSYAARLADQKLFVQEQTLHCACKQRCVPCLYKIAPEGPYSASSAAGDEASPYVPANVRPELCARLRDNQIGLDSGLAYDDRHNILLVGDGDFSFALALCTGLDRCCGGDKRGAVYATSHESHASLLATYPNVNTTLLALRSKDYVTLAHDVDATNIRETAADSVHAFSDKFDRVIWNFPCIRAPAGYDGQVDNLEENKCLLRGFFRNISAYLSDCGEVHVTHKTLEPFKWWDIAALAREEGLHHLRSVVFDRVAFPGYTNRKVLDRKSFPAHDAVTYVFTSRADCRGSEGEGGLLPGLRRYTDIREDVSELLRHFAQPGASKVEGKKRKRANKS